MLEPNMAARYEAADTVTTASDAWQRKEYEKALDLGRSAIRLNIWNPVAQTNQAKFYTEAKIAGDDYGTPLEYFARALLLSYPNPDAIYAYVRNHLDLQEFQCEVVDRKPLHCFVAFPSDHDFERVFSALPEVARRGLILDRTSCPQHIWRGCEPENVEVFRDIISEKYSKAGKVEFIGTLTKPQAWYLRELMRAWGASLVLMSLPLSKEEQSRFAAWIPIGAENIIVDFKGPRNGGSP